MLRLNIFFYFYDLFTFPLFFNLGINPLPAIPTPVFRYYLGKTRFTIHNTTRRTIMNGIPLFNGAPMNGTFLCLGVIRRYLCKKFIDSVKCHTQANHQSNYTTINTITVPLHFCKKRTIAGKQKQILCVYGVFSA